MQAIMLSGRCTFPGSAWVQFPDAILIMTLKPGRIGHQYPVARSRCVWGRHHGVSVVAIRVAAVGDPVDIDPVSGAVAGFAKALGIGHGLGAPTVPRRRLPTRLCRPALTRSPKSHECRWHWWCTYGTNPSTQLRTAFGSISRSSRSARHVSLCQLPRLTANTGAPVPAQPFPRN